MQSIIVHSAQLRGVIAFQLAHISGNPRFYFAREEGRRGGEEDGIPVMVTGGKTKENGQDGGDAQG